MTAKGALCIPVGLAAGLWCGISALRKTLLMARARHWPSVPGRIVESVIVPDLERKRTHFRVRYEFMMGERIESATPRIAGDWFWNNRGQEAFVARFAPGQPVEVYYDPRDPRRNCLDRDDRSGITARWLLSIGATVLSGLLLWAWWRERRP